jgi:hypothetical protein
MKSLVMLFMSSILVQVSFAADNNKLIPIKLYFLEALAPKDTTSSERFQKEYDFAIQTGKELTKKKFNDCGYELLDSQRLYDASDTLQAMENSRKAQEEGAWLIVGPRRSNHYLLVAKGAESTPTVSTMASSKEVYDLDTSHLTIGQSNNVMAEVLAKETKSKVKKSSKYISIVSEDCLSCMDFSAAFDGTGLTIGLKKLAEMKIVGEQPDAQEIEKFYRKHKSDIVVIPNYSKVSAYIIGLIYKINRKAFFVGGDGWGDNKYGFVHNSPQLKKANGLTVKGFPPADKGLAYFDLGKKILSEPSRAAAFPASGSAQSLLKIIEGVTNLICETKPMNKEQFVSIFNRDGQKYFFNPWGVSVFKLSEGEVIFDKTVSK